MRIAYVANYQGPTLGARRPIVRNLSMSSRVKVELIATMLHLQSHDVVIISPGEPGEPRLQLFPSFREPVPFHRDILVEYASALPVRRIAAAWSIASTLRLLRTLHSTSPFDLVLIFNMNWPQIAAAAYAIRRLRIPVILEYEDDAFTSVHGERPGPLFRPQRVACRRILESVSGCTAVSPYLLSQLPSGTPTLLLPGVVGDDIIRAEHVSGGSKKNWVVFAGTHIESNGVAPLIEAWKRLDIRDWELHITGHGNLTPTLQALAADVPAIVFHGFVDRSELVEILASARICINPHKVSGTPGMVFAFKIIEYLAAGGHVVTTPMGDIEAALENGVTYLPDNEPDSIAAALKAVIGGRVYERTAAEAAQRTYGPAAVSAALDRLVSDAVAGCRTRSAGGVQQL